jgi:hypothetical protein
MEEQDVENRLFRLAKALRLVWRDAWYHLKNIIEKMFAENDAKEAWEKLAFTMEEGDNWREGTSMEHKRPYFDFFIDLTKKLRDFPRHGYTKSEYRKKILEQSDIWNADWDIVWPPTQAEQLPPEEFTWHHDFQSMMAGWEALVNLNHENWRKSMQAFAKPSRMQKLGSDDSGRAAKCFTEELESLLDLKQDHWMQVKNRHIAHKLYREIVKVLVAETVLGILSV